MLGVLGIEAQASYGSGPAIKLLETITPPLILLDVNMPGVDGIEVLARIRKEKRLADVPVIVITSDDQPETKQRVMRGGATAMLLKPATLDALENALKEAKVL